MTKANLNYENHETRSPPRSLRCSGGVVRLGLGHRRPANLGPMPRRCPGLAQHFGRELYRAMASEPEYKHAVGNSHRSEEHTSELQSLRHLVCRLLLEKK